MAPTSQLILLETRAVPALALDHMQPGRQEQQQHSRLLNLPLDILEHIFAYLLVAPGEIYLGIVALEDRLPHHWHPASSLCREEPRDNRAGEDGLGRAPVCSHRRAQAPYDLCCSLLLVNKQLHLVAARMLYGRNAFAIDICVPTRDLVQQYDISRLQLEQIIPLNPVYHKLLRRVTFRHYNLWMLASPIRFFHSAMMHVLRDKPGTFSAFRRRYDAEHEGFDFEAFAGWAPAASPAWLDDAVTSLATSQPLIMTKMSMRIEEVHQQMSTLWESPMHSDSHAPKTSEEASCVDLCVMSDPAVHAGPWHPDDPRSRLAARIFLARPRNNRSDHPLQDDRMREWHEAKAYSRFQTFIVGKSRGLQQASVHNRQARGPHSTNQVWRAGPKGTMRPLFTAPMGLIVAWICRVLREEQLKREDRLRRNTGVDALVVLSVDAGGFTEPSRWRRHIDKWPSQYEFV